MDLHIRNSVSFFDTLPSLPAPFSVHVKEAVEIEQASQVSEMVRLRLITRQGFALSDKDAARVIAAMGELEIVEGEPVLRPCEIGHNRYSNWMRSNPPMALWRLGAAVAAFEFYAIEKCSVYRTRGIGPQDPRLKMFNLGLEQLRAFSDDPRLAQWLPNFRTAILQRLQMDLQEGTIVVEQLNRYCDFLNDLAKEGVAGQPARKQKRGASGN